jgi:hypothetical protein
MLLAITLFVFTAYLPFVASRFIKALFNMLVKL